MSWWQQQMSSTIAIPHPSALTHPIVLFMPMRTTYLPTYVKTGERKGRQMRGSAMRGVSNLLLLSPNQDVNCRVE